MTTPLCRECQLRPCQVNYIKNSVRHYRSRCYSCAQGRKKIPNNNIVLGYKKKPKCERCGFVPKIPEQLRLHYADYNAANSNFKNLRTVCCNCAAELDTLKLPWTAGDLTPDF
jgi:hypothetical protein